jgi:ribosomal protein L32
MYFDRMKAEQVLELRCPLCGEIFYPHKTQFHILYEHSKESKCNNDGKYIVLKREIIEGD